VAALAVICGLFIRSMPRVQRTAQRLADAGAQ
jgi:hypothetical protein